MVCDVVDPMYLQVEKVCRPSAPRCMRALRPGCIAVVPARRLRDGRRTPAYVHLAGSQTVGMALPLILNKYMGLFVAMAFFPVMAFTIPFLVCPLHRLAAAKLPPRARAGGAARAPGGAGHMRGPPVRRPCPHSPVSKSCAFPPPSPNPVALGASRLSRVRSGCPFSCPSPSYRLCSLSSTAFSSSASWVRGHARVLRLYLHVCACVSCLCLRRHVNAHSCMCTRVLWLCACACACACVRACVCVCVCVCSCALV